jgi:hypothetical protein
MSPFPSSIAGNVTHPFSPSMLVPEGLGEMSQSQSGPGLGRRSSVRSDHRKERDVVPLSWMSNFGPWATVEEALNSLNAQWRTSSTGTGVFHKGSSMYRTNQNQRVPIRRKMLYCYMKFKSSCKFNIIIMLHMAY